MKYIRDRISNTKPEEIVLVSSGLKNYFIVSYDIIQNEDFWEYNQMLLPTKNLDYGEIVNQIISKKYPTDKMQAIINNYLFSKDIGEREFNEMQQYRLFAKNLACKILNFKK